MKRSELIAIESHDEFGDLIMRCRLPREKKVGLIRERWDNLYAKYPPDPQRTERIREYLRRQEARADG